MSRIIKKLLATAISFTPVGTLISTSVQAALAELDTKATAAFAAGDVKFVATSTAPTGWLKANGALVSRTVYAALFAKIGTTFGAGDGATTFALPDFRGEFLRGFDDGRGVDASRVFGSAQGGQVEAHVHGMNSALALGGGGILNNSGNAAQQLGNTTSYGGNETRPRNIAVLVVIKY